MHYTCQVPDNSGVVPTHYNDSNVTHASELAGLEVIRVSEVRITGDGLLCVTHCGIIHLH